MKIIATAALLLGLSSGSALADRRHGESWGHRSSRHAWNPSGTWHGSVQVRPQWTSYRGHREYVAPRRPIYVSSPIIRERYFDFRIRPRVVVENYAPMTGYYWVNGRWDWNGVEWQWTPGHYEPQQTYSSYPANYYPTNDYQTDTYPTDTYYPTSSYQETHTPSASCDHDHY